MFYIKDQRATIWEIENKDTYSVVKMSTSRKDKEGKYINSNWAFVKFVGKAQDKADRLAERDRIEITSGGISKESYMKDGEKLYPKNPAIVVFDFKWVGDSEHKNEGGSSEKDDDYLGADADSELPF